MSSPDAPGPLQLRGDTDVLACEGESCVVPVASVETAEPTEIIEPE